MPGSQRNGWSSYLNGGTSQYNFSYIDEKHNSESSPEPAHPQAPAPQPTPTPIPNNRTIPPPTLPNVSPQPTIPPAANKKKQTGGKRKSKRHKHSHKKYRQTRHK